MLLLKGKAAFHVCELFSAGWWTVPHEPRSLSALPAPRCCWLCLDSAFPFKEEGPAVTVKGRVCPSLSQAPYNGRLELLKRARCEQITVGKVDALLLHRQR